MKKKNGFTLIELLAVIIILGILMIIAIPSVTKYISDSRKNAYIDTAKEIIGSARNLVNSGELEMYDTGATYYIDVNCINTENAMKSPYGEFVSGAAFVIVTYNGKGYDYYWTSVDDAGQGIKGVIRYDKLDTDNIESDLTSDDINTNRTIDGRGKVIIIDKSHSCKKEIIIDQNLTNISGETGEEKSIIEYPSGKNKETVVTGDIVKIGTEEFYVVKHDGNDLILLSHYNLKVGNVYDISWNKIKEYTNSDQGYGLQSSEVKGFVGFDEFKYGTIAFSTTDYWDGKVGEGLEYPGTYCYSNTYTPGTTCAYLYDSNSNLYQYVENYKNYLQGQGAQIKSARLLRIEEAFELGCGQGTYTCSYSTAHAPSWVYETSYWLGSSNASNVWYIKANDIFDVSGYMTATNYGLRPVIVI